MIIPKSFIEKIPKTDLHVHLDGSIRLSTLIELARRYQVDLPAYTQKGLKTKVFKKRYNDLGEYLQGFAYTTAVLQHESSLERVAYELAWDNMNEGVRYIEVRFAPQLHQSRRLSILDVLKAVTRGLTKAKNEFNKQRKIKEKKEPPFAFGLIVCAMRMFEADYSEYFRTLIEVHKHSDKTWVASLAAQELVKASIEARDRHGCPVTGFDLAGMEKGYPAADFKVSYDLAHKHFLNKTVHAGENYGPESIFQAITELHADRIGHGLYLFDYEMIEDEEIEDPKAYVENLVHYIGDRRITLEISLTSNLQTNPAIKRLSQHPFNKMRKARLSATFCTDNRTISATTVTNELQKAVKTFKLSPKELKDYVIYGFKRSFYPGLYFEKRRYVRQVIDYYEALEKDAGLA